jgi:hypothetical protein
VIHHDEKTNQHIDTAHDDHFHARHRELVHEHSTGDDSTMKKKGKSVAAIVFFALAMTSFAYAALWLSSGFYWMIIDDEVLDLSFPIVYAIMGVAFLIVFLTFKKHNPVMKRW